MTGAEPPATIVLDYDERAYLATYDDVIMSLDTGEFSTAREHFDQHGHREGRLTDELYIAALGQTCPGSVVREGGVFELDTVVASDKGTALIVGWADDRDSPLHSLSVFIGRDRAWNTTAFGRVRRTDVETAVQSSAGHLFGFWAVVQLAADIPQGVPWIIRGRARNGAFRQVEIRPRVMPDADMRTTILGYFAATECYGNRDVESFSSLSAGIGDSLVALNRRITGAVTAGAWASYYGPTRKGYLGSIIVCLYGKSEFMFLQAALFSAAPRAREYEYVYVSNSPELTEVLVKEAQICAQIYDISIVLVCLPDNAGFGAANNVAARFARSGRLLITNPDVFPRNDAWARRHADIVETAPREQTQLFGAPLYYDDGSLMHHGMYFEIDQGISMRPDAIVTRPMIRTEHYAKGAPAWSTQFACPRPVPAITGAFMSADRAWFELLGGFNEDFLFGHYEDADLSLKSLARGRPTWIQDLPLWHMEGKGSVRRAAHEGGILVNRWLFSRLWGGLIASDLRGASPSCALMRPAAAVAAPALPVRTAKKPVVAASARSRRG